MQRTISSIFVVVMLGFFTVSFAQLPPKIMADKHQVQAERLYAVKDYVGAFNAMGKVVALQKEHGLTLSADFHFKYARIAVAADSLDVALDAVSKYLSATEDAGEFYNEALALLLDLEGVQTLAEESCAKKAVGSSCWAALTSHPGCYVWNDELEEGETAAWNGECSGRLARGKGTITWAITKGDSVEVTKRASGEIQKGKPYGQWIIRYPDGDVKEGSYAHGKMSGPVVYRFKNKLVGGYIRYGVTGVAEGPYVDGKEHGKWVYRIEESHTGEVLFVHGKKQGEWISRDSDGEIATKGFYVDDKKEGKWSEREGASGRIIDQAYKNGVLHGPYFRKTMYKREDGSGYYSTLEGSYVDGKKVGKWISKGPRGRQEYFYLEDGGFKLIDYNKNGSLSFSETYDENGEKTEYIGVHGRNYYTAKGQYIDGKREGEWLEYEDGKCWSRTYLKGIKVSEKKVDKERCRVQK